MEEKSMAMEPQNEESGLHNEKKTSRKKRGIFIGCLVAAVLVVSYCALCVAGNKGVIYPNVTVSGVNLGGMTCEAAEAALQDSVSSAAPEEDRGVLFALEPPEGEPVTVKAPLSSAQVDCGETSARAWQVGNSQPFLARGGIYLKCLLAGETVLPAYGNSEKLEEILSQMDEQVGYAAVESSWEKTETNLVLTKGKTGYLIDRDSLKQEIFQRMGAGDVVELEGSQPQFTVPLKEVYPEVLDLKAILSEVEQPVQDAVFDKAGKRFQVDHVGITFDPEQAQTFFDEMAWGETKELPLTITQPKTTVKDLTPSLYQDTLGSCSTNIAGSANRVQNIKLAAQFFNGTILMPGEEFSYNGIVGRRTAARGFLPAPAYVGGESVQETGGGVCQGSSTIYLATLRANLEIVERYNHGYITRYVPDGMDATVYYGAKDFRFKNNTPFPIKVVGSVSGRTLTVNIMGTKSDNIKVEMTNKTVGTTGYKTVYKVDESLPAGSTRVSVTPYNGYTVKVYRNLYENGTLIDTKLESTSVYRSRDKVVMVSPADAYQYGIPGYSKPAASPAENAEV